LVANAELAQAQAGALRTLIGAQLAIIMRDREGGDYVIGSSLPELAAPPMVDKKGAAVLLEQARANRFELQAIDAAIASYGYGEDAVRAGGYPRLDAVGELTVANPNQRYFPVEEKWNASWSAGVVASFSFDAPFFGDAQGDELRAAAAGLRATRSGLEAMVVNEVVTAQLDIAKASAALTAGEVSVRAAEEAYRVSTDLFRVGRGTTSDLIDAESDLLATKLSVVNARIDLAIAALKLQYAMGLEPKLTSTPALAQAPTRE
jgi:outer membrane protein TolC